jgi:hypothetical protein
MGCELIFQAVSNCVGFLGRMTDDLRPEGPWIAVCALGPSLFRRDFAMGHIAWGLTPELPISSHPSYAFLPVILLIDFVTQLTAVLHAGSLASCNNSLSLCMFYQPIQNRKFVVYVRKWNFTGRQPICRSNRGCKVARRFIGLYPWVNFDSGWY